MPVYNNDIDLKSHLEMLSFQVAFYYAFSFVKRSETTTASYAGEIKSLKQGISTCDIIFGVQANKISKGEMPYGK